MTTGSATIRTFEPLEPGLDSDPQTQIYRIFVYFLQNLFRQFPEGCGMRWDANQKNAEMLITAEKPRLEVIEKMPHVVCVLGSGQFSLLGLDQMQSTRMATGQRVHTDLLPMTMAYHCQAKEGLHARRIAWNAMFYTVVLRRLLMGRGKFHHVSPAVTMSAESGPTAYVGPLAEEEIVSVVVTVPFFWQPSWTIREPSEVLRKFSMTMRIPNSTVNPPRIKGRPVYPVNPEDPAADPLRQTTVVSED